MIHSVACQASRWLIRMVTFLDIGECSCCRDWMLARKLLPMASWHFIVVASGFQLCAGNPSAILAIAAGYDQEPTPVTAKQLRRHRTVKYQHVLWLIGNGERQICLSDTHLAPARVPGHSTYSVERQFRQRAVNVNYFIVIFKTLCQCVNCDLGYQRGAGRY